MKKKNITHNFNFVTGSHFFSDKRKCLYFPPNEMKADKKSRYEVGCCHILFQNQLFGLLELAVFLIC